MISFLPLLVGERVVHFERGENALLEKFAEGLAGNFGDDQAEDYVAGIAVVPLGAGREHGVIGLFEEGQDFGVLDLVFFGPMMRKR